MVLRVFLRCCTLFCHSATLGTIAVIALEFRSRNWEIIVYAIVRSSAFLFKLAFHVLSSSRRGEIFLITADAKGMVGFLKELTEKIV